MQEYKRQTEQVRQASRQTWLTKAIFGEKFAGTEKSGYLCTPEPEGSPGRKYPGLTRNSPEGLSKANHGAKVGNDGV